jgi:hypothetical protein
MLHDVIVRHRIPIRRNKKASSQGHFDLPSGRRLPLLVRAAEEIAVQW